MELDQEKLTRNESERSRELAQRIRRVFIIEKIGKSKICRRYNMIPVLE